MATKSKKSTDFDHRVNKYVNRKMSNPLTKAQVSSAASFSDEEEDNGDEDDDDNGHGCESKSTSLTSNSSLSLRR